jgi:hypothetical protein
MISKKCGVVLATATVVVCLAFVYMESDPDTVRDGHEKPASAASAAAVENLTILKAPDSDQVKGSSSLSTQTSMQWAQCQNQLAQSTLTMAKGFDTSFSTAKSVILGGLKEALDPVSHGTAFCSLKGKLRRWIADNHALQISITGGSASQVKCEKSQDTYGSMLERGLKQDFENGGSCGARPVLVTNVAQVFAMCMCFMCSRYVLCLCVLCVAVMCYIYVFCVYGMHR